MTRMRDRMREGVSRDRLVLEARRSVRPLAIYAVATAVALASLGFVLSSINGVWPWETRDTVRVRVPDATGVSAGQNEVRVSGVRVGKVTSARLVDGRAVLTLSIDPQYGPIHRDARVVVRPQTPLQDQYVDIVDRGTARAGKLGSDEVLPAQRAAASVDLPAVLDTFNGDVRVRLKALIDNFGYGLRGNGDQLRAAIAEIAPLLRNARRVAAQLARRRTITARLVHNLALLTGELGRRDRQLTGLVRDGSRTVTALAGSRASLRRIITALPQTLERMRSTFARTRSMLDALDPSLRALGPTAAALGPGLSDLRRITNAATPALDRLLPAVRSLEPLARSLRPATDDLSSAFRDLAPQAARFDRITAKLEPCELAVQKFFQWTPSVFKFGDAYGTYPRGETTLGTNSVASATRDPNLTQGPSCTGQAR